MKIQYHHSRIPSGFMMVSSVDTELRSMNLISLLNPRGGQTIAIESLKPWIVKTLTVGDFFTKQLGKARCSDEDNYNKATGRELAKSRMKAVILTVVEIDGEILVLQDEKKNRYTFKGSYFVGYDGLS